MTTKHPAKFTPEIIKIANKYINANSHILDPFCGPGKLFFDMEKGRKNLYCYGTEIEPEWVTDHQRHFAIDAFEFFKLMRTISYTFDVVFTSCTYGNRMADHHNAKDGSVRHTYKHYLGRDLSDNNSGSMQWSDEYREFHERAWQGVYDVLYPGGKFILNVKNHIRQGVEQEVSEWHRDTVIDLGFTLIADEHVNAPGLRHGENYEKRTVIEHVYVFERGI